MVFGYNAVLIVVSMMVLYSMMNSVHYGYSMDYSETVSLYVVMAYIEFGMILLIIPAIFYRHNNFHIFCFHGF